MAPRFARLIGMTFVAGLAFVPAAHASPHVSVQVGIGAPVQVAPVVPAARAGYVWQPGYYVRTRFGYEWVPGTWVPAPYTYRSERRGWDRDDRYRRGGWDRDDRYRRGDWDRDDGRYRDRDWDRDRDWNRDWRR